MTGAEAVRQAVQNANISRDTLRKSDFGLSSGSPGVRENVASVQVNRPHAVMSGKKVDLAIMAYEEKTTDGTADNTETFSVTHDLVESGATDQDIIIYEGDQLVQPDSVDYANDSFDYTDDGTNNTLGVYYASGTQAQVEIVKTAPNGVDETLWTGDVGLLHMRDHAKEPVEFELNQHYWQPFIPTDWTLDVYVNAPYTARWAKDIGGDGNDEPAINSLLGIPVRKASETINGLSRLTRLAAAES